MNVKMPSIKSVARELVGLKRWCEPGDDESIDVRLQVYDNGSWCVHSGDSSYDQDHRGHWGCGGLTTRSNCYDVARDLIDQCAESAAMTSDE